MCIRQRIEGSNPSLTAIFKERACTQVRAFLRLYRASPGRDENPRPGFDHWRSQWDSLRASRADCPKGEAQRAESIPPSPPYSKKKPELTLRLFCVYIASTQGGMRTLGQGSTGGLPPGRQDRLRACRPKGEAQRAESIPPSPPYLKKEPELTLRLFCVYISRPEWQVRCAYLPYAHQAHRLS